MTIDISTVREKQLKEALESFLKFLDDKIQADVIKVIKSHSITDIKTLITLRDHEIDNMDLIVVDTQTQQTSTTPVSQIIKSAIRDVKEFAVHCLTPESAPTTFSAVKQDDFETWQIDGVIKRSSFAPATPATPGAPTTTTTTTTTTSSGVDIVKRIEAIDKYELKGVPQFNGSIGDYPRFKRITVQHLTNHGMADIADNTYTPPTKNTHNNRWILWNRQNQFVCTALTLKITGGQAAVIVREHAGKENGAHTIFSKLIEHYESTSNKAAQVTTITGKLTKLKHTTRSNYNMVKHLEKFQNLLLDLDDIEVTAATSTAPAVTAKPGDVQIKSHLCNSVQHHSFTSMIDACLTDASKTYPIMITELTQKAERMSTPNPNARSLNNTNTSRGGRNKNNRNKDNKNNEWRKPPHVWARMSREQKEEFLRKKNEARRTRNDGSDGASTPPVPASNYGNLNSINAVLQYAALPAEEQARMQQVLSAFTATTQPPAPTAQANNATAASAPAPAPAPPSSSSNAPTSTGNSLLTHLLNTSVRQLHNTSTKVVEDPSMAPSRTRNPNLPGRSPLGHRCFDSDALADMEISTEVPLAESVQMF